jgi:pyruvate-formate lyase-activating enzyme
MVWADGRGNMAEQPGWRAAGMRGHETVPLDPDELIPLPAGSELFLLPGRRPVGYPDDAPRLFTPPRGGDALAVAAFLAPAHTQYLLPAYRSEPGAPILPLYAYTALAFVDGEFRVPGVRVDPDRRQEPGSFDCREIEQGIARLLAGSPGNRLLVHLARCAREYFCPAARNLFLARHEAPLPSSPACNASCVGCISLQPSGCCPSTQARITFVPEPEELAGVAVGHFDRVPGGVASFGQGCEGEPLLVADTLERAIRLIRRATPAGTINLNTNGSRPDEIARLAAAGLRSIRVSLNSARADCYQAYYRPTGYAFGDVVETIRQARAAGLFISLNYFVFPGVTDQPAEVEALADLVAEGGVDMIQWRNLNIDPELYLASVDSPPGGMGIRRAMAEIRRRFPRLRFGYFNPTLLTKITLESPGA